VRDGGGRRGGQDLHAHLLHQQQVPPSMLRCSSLLLLVGVLLSHLLPVRIEFFPLDFVLKLLVDSWNLVRG
jgi:hypothetical protein